MSNQHGSAETKDFYNKIGWRKKDGATYDRILFGDKEVGPIRKELDKVHELRIRNFVSQSGDRVKLLECGCGGNPAHRLFDLCSSYTGVDFSEQGLEVARSHLENTGLEHHLQQADVCALPFPDESFDTVYSAHMIYHIDNPQAQERALREMFRVVRKGGVLVMVTANPRPLLFPMRLAIRMLDDMPILGPLLQRQKKGSPLPYKPMKLSWYKRVLNDAGRIDTVTNGLPSTWANQNISEQAGLGNALWKTFRYLDIKFPRLAAYLGNYVVIASHKPN